MKDELGDRMKGEEGKFKQTLNSDLPIIVRLDGRAFHTLTHNLTKPFDINFMALMQKCLDELMEEFNFYYGYVQSDEISLLWYKKREESQPLFGGVTNKINSILAAHCSVFFNSEKVNNFNNLKTGLFDCRSFNVPSKEEEVNYFVWRGKDCTRNSISMLAQTNFSHKELQGKKTNEMLDMLSQKKIVWSDLASFITHGTAKKYNCFYRITDSVTPVMRLKDFTERYESIFN